LDPRSVGYYKIDPLVRQLSGIPTIDFMVKPLLKLGHLTEDRDLSRDQFRSMISSVTTENMNYDEFCKSILALRSSTFEISNEEVDVLFKHIAGVQRTQGASVSLSRVVAEVFLAVHAILIEKMRDKLARDQKFLPDLLIRHDSNKDSFLTHGEVEDLLRKELHINLGPKMFTDILIAEILDVEKKRGKVSFDMLKLYMGDNSSRSSGKKIASQVDLVPSSDNAAPHKSVA
jgi:hypothetical protein